MNNPIIYLNSPKLKYTGVCLDNPHRVTINDGVTAVVGANGAGKSALGAIIDDGWHYMDNEIESATGQKLRVRKIAFSDIHSLSGFGTEYYQQRYESTMNDDVPSIRDLMGERIDTDLWRQLTQRLHLDVDLERKLNFLSSGETRKLLIINILLDLPQVLILDNPYIGLDAPSRLMLDKAIKEINGCGTAIMLLLSDTSDIPEYADTVIPMHNLEIGAPVTVAELHSDTALMAKLKGADTALSDIDRLLETTSHPRSTDPLVILNHCQVKYGRNVLINDVNWQIRSGECWALTGRNGSGKSTLLSLINADNPQSYSNDITLFGRRRGTGESIWDIKSRIGHLSSELHLYFNTRLDTLREVVAGGLSNFNRAARADTDNAHVDRWLSAFNMSNLADRRFKNLSAGEQRLALFIRAVIKKPELLILDEPMHGLDPTGKTLVKYTVERVAEVGTTIIYVTHCPDELPNCVTHTKNL